MQCLTLLGCPQADFPTRRKEKEAATWETYWVSENGTTVSLEPEEAVPDELAAEDYENAGKVITVELAVQAAVCVGFEIPFPGGGG